MSALGPESPERALVERILEDARRQADALEAEAASSVRMLEEQYREEVRAVEEQCAGKARHDALALRNRVLARARVDARNIVLQGREAAMKKVLARVESAIMKMRDDIAGYRTALANLLVEGILGVDSAELVAVIGAGDRAIVDEAMLEDVRKRAYEQSGRDIGLEIEFDERDLGGGCIVMERGGRLRLDNTIPGRIRETRRQLRLLIAAELEKNRG